MLIRVSDFNNCYTKKDIYNQLESDPQIQQLAKDRPDLPEKWLWHLTFRICYARKDYIDTTELFGRHYGSLGFKNDNYPTEKLAPLGTACEELLARMHTEFD